MHKKKVFMILLIIVAVVILIMSQSRNNIKDNEKNLSGGINSSLLFADANILKIDHKNKILEVNVLNEYEFDYFDDDVINLDCAGRFIDNFDKVTEGTKITFFYFYTSLGDSPLSISHFKVIN